MLHSTRPRPMGHLWSLNVPQVDSEAPFTQLVSGKTSITLSLNPHLHTIDKWKMQSNCSARLCPANCAVSYVDALTHIFMRQRTCYSKGHGSLMVVTFWKAFKALYLAHLIVWSLIPSCFANTSLQISAQYEAVSVLRGSLCLSL